MTGKGSWFKRVVDKIERATVSGDEAQLQELEQQINEYRKNKGKEKK